MSDYKDFTFYPVTGWHIGPLAGHPALVLQFHCLAPDAPPGSTPQQSPFFGLTAKMTRALITSLGQHLKTLEATDDRV